MKNSILFTSILTCLLSFVLTSQALLAQISLPCGTTTFNYEHETSSSGLEISKRYVRKISAGVTSITFTLKGGAGGNAHLDQFALCPSYDRTGGAGATVTVTYPVGPNVAGVPADKLEEGGLLLFIVGEAGDSESNSGCLSAQGGGGGSSGVGYRPPGDNTQNWYVLGIAGAGGGALLATARLNGRGGRSQQSGGAGCINDGGSHGLGGDYIFGLGGLQGAGFRGPGNLSSEGSGTRAFKSGFTVTGFGSGYGGSYSTVKGSLLSNGGRGGWCDPLGCVYDPVFGGHGFTGGGLGGSSPGAGGGYSGGAPGSTSDESSGGGGSWYSQHFGYSNPTISAGADGGGGGNGFIKTVTTTGPSAKCKNHIAYLGPTGIAAIIPNDVDNGSSHVCGTISTRTVFPNSFDCSNLGVNTVTLTITDGSNHSAPCTATVTVRDNIPPTIGCPDNYTTNVDAGQCSAVVNHFLLPGGPFGQLALNDNCGNGTTAEVTSGPASNTPHPVGTSTISYTATDAGGNTSTCSFNVTVIDNEDLAITCPADMTVQIQTGCVAIVNYTTPVGTDNCGGTVTTLQTAGFPSGDHFFYGPTLNAFRVTDGSGNTATCSFTINVIDTTPPEITCPPDYSTNVDAGQCSAIVDHTAIGLSYNDGCGPILNYTSGPTNLSPHPVGTSTISLTVTDAFENVSTCSFTVTVTDNEAPIANCHGGLEIGLDASGNASITGASINNASTDACGIASLTASPNTFNSTNAGANTVTLTVTDHSGNTASCTSTVVVNVCLNLSIVVPPTAGITSKTCTTPGFFTAPVTNTCPAGSTLQFSTGGGIWTATLPAYDQNSTTGNSITTRCNCDSDNSYSSQTRGVIELPPPSCTGVRLSAKVFLQGPYETASTMMHDQLRAQSLVPTTEPYTAATQFTHVVGGGETADLAVFNTTGNNAIVDWVFVELRSQADPAMVLYTRSALLQRNGDIVDADGSSALYFAQAAVDNYYVCVRHRNHLGIMTQSSLSLSANTSSIDFTNANTPTFGNNARINLGNNVMGMYASDIDASGSVNATDRSAAWNERNLIGYRSSDTNLDGTTNASDRSAAWNNRNINQELAN